MQKGDGLRMMKIYSCGVEGCSKRHRAASGARRCREDWLEGVLPSMDKLRPNPTLSENARIRLQALANAIQGEADWYATKFPGDVKFAEGVCEGLRIAKRVILAALDGKAS